MEKVTALSFLLLVVGCRESPQPLTDARLERPLDAATVTEAGPAPLADGVSRAPDGARREASGPTDAGPLLGHFVAPSGKATAKGTLADPWDLATALAHPAAVVPGDTIWLRGGSYLGTFALKLKGAQGKPIVVRQYPGERAIIDPGAKDKAAVVVEASSWVDLQGFEVTFSKNDRTYPVDAQGNARPNGGDGIRISSSHTSHHLRFINLVVHDLLGMGFGFWSENTDSSIYGCLIYYNGANQLDHGIYTQNQTGRKEIADSFLFDNASHGLSAYGSSDAYLHNFDVVGNTVFTNGSIGYNTIDKQLGFRARNILVGGGSLTSGSKIDSNVTYYPYDGSSDGQTFNLGYGGGSKDTIVTSNYFVGAKLLVTSPVTNLTFAGNTIATVSSQGVSASQHPGNTWLGAAPSAPRIVVRPNRFDPRRANVTIVNWSKQPSVSVPAAALTGVAIQSGDAYELRNVADYFNDVVKGTYDGQAIPVPMAVAGHTVAQPVGRNVKPPSTFPAFGAFVLQVRP